MDEKKAFAYALRLLAKRAYLSGRLSEKMEGKGASQEVIRSVLERVTRLKFVDDRDYVQRFARERSSRGYGPRWIEASLRQKGLQVDFIREALKDEEADEDPVESACHALRASAAFRRKSKVGEEPRKRNERLYAFLARRGFSSSVALSALRRLEKGEIET
jgi:regulatory protein